MRLAVLAGLLGSLVLALGGGVAAAQSDSPMPTPGASSAPPSPGGSGQPSQQDTMFMTDNAQIDLAEISAGQLAQQRSPSPAIHQTAQTIVADHQLALSQLQGVARSAGVTLPTAPSTAMQQQAQQLMGLSGAAFDQLYLSSEIQGHEGSISQTQQEIASGSDQQVIGFATSYLPVAQKHLQLLQADQRQLAGGSPTGVNAGSGGQAAPWATAPLVAALLGGGALLVAGSAALMLLRRRRA
jgi:putative membrane protein